MGKASSAKKVARAARSGGSSRKNRPKLAFPLGIFAVVLVGALLVVYARVDHTNTASADTKPSYAASDHWHAAYGFYDCDHYLGALTDALPTDELGIHTHGDGLIHIHPFKASSSGENARMNLWAKQVGMTFYDDGWKMPDGTEFRNGSAKCGDQPAKTAVYKWNHNDPSQPTTVFEKDYGNINYTEDGDVFIFAVLPQDWPANKVPPAPESVSALANPLAAEGGGSASGAGGLNLPTGADTGGVTDSSVAPSSPTP
jgi:hypothetical protein